MRRLLVPMRLVALPLAVALCPPTTAVAQEQLLSTPCREMRTLDAMEYWFWDAFSGLAEVHDLGQERVGRLEMDPAICFRIAVLTVDNPQQKNAGIRQAVGELIMWLAGDDAPEDEVERAAERLERITGERFDTYIEWDEWWTARSDFVLWSEEEDRLVVVESAMAAGEAIHDEALVLSPEEYWFYAGRGWLLQDEAVGRYVLGTVLIPPHDFNFRIERTELDNRGAKESGYRRALENLVVDGLLLPEISASSLQTIVTQMEALTGETHADREAWVAWWNANSDRLALSASGDRLVVRQ